ncbi:tyrosine-protein phosphatase non-receptor type substrate 1-like [Clarias gariepinus]|uniref:tyrosine-protein phosphatase non-receptor type substrate 1-like n=1 Tax=Clarias gariepinus TaxID=13013 RepID=UPI00234E2476|nr:tyrosine-protein phosphatase non-receptor type substrate 1-like [Clarias gariepinus]
MITLWIWSLIFSIFCNVQTGRRWVTAQSFKESPVYQPNKELIVDPGDSATLWCCISEKEAGKQIAWFKQPKGKKPQIIVTIYKTAGETFLSEPFTSQLQIGRYLNCFNMTISRIIQSDEAMYYCALITPNIVFADGTYLKIKGEHVTIASETSKPALSDHSLMCEPTLHGNSTNTQEKTVLGLGMALGLCALLIFCLTYFLLRRRMDGPIETFPGLRKESHFNSLAYKSFKLIKWKVHRRGIDDLVYTNVMYGKV